MEGVLLAVLFVAVCCGGCADFRVIAVFDFGFSAYYSITFRLIFLYRFSLFLPPFLLFSALILAVIFPSNIFPIVFQSLAVTELFFDCYFFCRSFCANTPCRVCCVGAVCSAQASMGSLFLYISYIMITHGYHDGKGA